MKSVAILSLAASLRLGSVRSFQIPPPSRIVSIKKSGAATTAEAKPKPRSSTTSPLFAIFFLDDPQAALEEIKRQYAEITESLDQAKKREDEAQENADLLREERAGVDSETEMVISRLKRDFSEEISDLSDKIEGAQDDLRKTITKTKSEISNIRGEVHEREERLYSEISELEYRLEALRKDAKNAAKERDAAKNSLRKDERDAMAASRKEMEKAKREAFQEKKKLTRESWALESRFQQAKEGLKPAMSDLEEAKRQDATLPMVSSLKDALMEITRKMMPKVDELKENLAANEMFFDQSLKKVEEDKKLELDAAKSAYEGEILAEDEKLENATSYYDSQLNVAEKKLQRSIELSAKPVEPAGDGAIAAAAKNRIALYQDKYDAVASIQAAREDAMKKVVESHSAIQDQYDAEYENERRNLKFQDARAKRELQREDKRREKRKRQLQRDMEELTRKLSLMMKGEREVAEQDYQNLKRRKTTELDDSMSRANGARNEVQTTRSNLKMVEYELKTLEKTFQEQQDALSELEEERTSFRKQARRTVAVAIGRITRRGP